jgi:hypothetical protein
MKQMVTAILAALSLCLASGAYAQGMQCGPRAGIVQQLEQKHKETRIAGGMINERLILEVFASAAGTWTMLLTNSEGVSCFHGAGDAWEWSTDTFKPGRAS